MSAALAHSVGVSVSRNSVSGIRSPELLIFPDFLCMSEESLKLRQIFHFLLSTLFVSGWGCASQTTQVKPV